MPTGVDDFESYVTPAPSPRGRSYRTDRNNNPIAAAVSAGSKNQFTSALDQAGIPWEHGDAFPSNEGGGSMRTIRIKGDPVEGARAILGNSNALSWYRKSTGKAVLPKYGVNTADDFNRLSVDKQNEIIDGIYRSEGGSGALTQSKPDPEFDKYVMTQQSDAPDPDFEKHVQPFADVSAGASGVQPVRTTPQVTSSVRELDTGTELSVPQPLDVKAADDALAGLNAGTPGEFTQGPKPLEFKPGTVAPENPVSLNPVENIYNELSKPHTSVRGIAGLQAKKYQAPDSHQLGERVTLPISRHVTPSEDEVVNGYLSTLGPEYVKAGEQYKAQTGHSILTLGGGALKQDEKGNYYVRPSKGAVDFINTYVQSGGDLDKAMAEASRQSDEYIAAQNKAFTESKPNVEQAHAAMETAKGSPVLRGMIGGTAGAAQAFGSVLPGALGNEFERQAAVERAATEQVNKDAPLTNTGDRIKAGIGGLIPTAAMLIATHKLGPAQLAALGVLEGSTPQERLRGGLQGAAAQAVLGGAPAAFTEAGLPTTGKAVTSGAMVAQPATEAWQRGESPTQAITENLPFAALPFLHGKGAEEKPTELGVDRAQTVGVPGEATANIDQTLAAREAAVKPTTHAIDVPAMRVVDTVQGAPGVELPPNATYPDTKYPESLGVVGPTKPVEGVEEGAKLNRWQHRDFGRVTESADQSGVGRARVRVLAEDGTEHVIQRPNMRGEGNQIAVPIREKPLSAQEVDAQGQADRVAPFRVIDRRGQTEPQPAVQALATSPPVEPPVASTEAAPVMASTPEPTTTLERRPVAQSPETVIRQRSFPKTLERAGLQGGDDRDYTVLTNREAITRAVTKIKADGVDRSIADLTAKKEIEAEDTATGIILIRHLQEQGNLESAVDVASDLSRKLTQAGQATQAASIVSRLSPEGVLLAAQKELPADKKLTRGQAQSLTEQAQRVERAEQRISVLEKQMQDSGALPVTEKSARQRVGNLQERLVRMEQDARARLNARKAQMIEATKGQPRGQRGAAVNPAAVALDIADYSVIGASKLAQKGITAAEWSKQMAEEFGDAIKPHLDRIYKSSYALYDEQRKQFLQESRVRGALRAQPDTKNVQAVINERLDAQTEARKARADLARTFRDLSATPLQRLGRGIVDVTGLTRALTTTADLSFGFRQGKMGLARHPKIWADAFVKQFKALNTKQYERLVSQLETDPDFKYAKRFGLDLTSVGSSEHAPLGVREEAFQSRFVQKLPIVKHSEQAYSTMADHLRMGWFKDYMQNLKKLGLDPENPKDRQAFEEGASLVNNATGRGSLGRLQSASPALATVIFSPRFWASRLKMMSLPLDPRTYTTMSRPARVEAFKTLLSYGALVSSQLALAKLSGAEVDTDPNSPDFLKARWGKLHVDFSGGFQSHIRVAARLMKSFYDRQQGRTSKTEPVNVLEHYFRGKESPNASLVHDLFLAQKTKVGGETYGTDFKGDPTALLGVPGRNRRDTSALANRLLPMVYSDASDAYDADGWTGVAEAMPLTLTGEGVSVYDPKKRRGH